MKVIDTETVQGLIKAYFDLGHEPVFDMLMELTTQNIALMKAVGVMNKIPSNIPEDIQVERYRKALAELEEK